MQVCEEKMKKSIINSYPACNHRVLSRNGYLLENKYSRKANTQGLIILYLRKDQGKEEDMSMKKKRKYMSLEAVCFMKNKKKTRNLIGLRNNL